MPATKRLRRVPFSVEVALAIATGAASFALVAVAIVATGSTVFAVVLGVACIAAVVATARWLGTLYASPLAIASLLAFEWYSFPPTHSHEFPSSADLADLVAYLAVAVLVGALAALAGRSAQISEAARTALLSELAASRARIVAAADAERRRVVADLHDGAQQRLVSTAMTLKLALHALEDESGEGPALVREALAQAEDANEELRELAHGIHPAVLTVGGLHAGVAALATRAPIPVDNGVVVGRLPTAVEATAYFVVAEALTNVAKHARADRAAVTARVEDGTLSVQVRDDGVGGARAEGNGLVGLADRVAALDGRLRVESLSDGGTLVAAAIPLAGL